MPRKNVKIDVVPKTEYVVFDTDTETVIQYFTIDKPHQDVTVKELLAEAEKYIDDDHNGCNITICLIAARGVVKTKTEIEPK